MISTEAVRRGALALILASTSTAALAQSAPPASPDDRDQQTTASPATGAGPDSSAGDIIVTAQRRDASLARTPVAVQVVSAEALQRAQVKNELDLRFATPGLQIRSGQSSNSISFSLRGQSQDPQSDTRPGVLPYYNEIPVAGQGLTTAFYDLQSIQVLKGPQGTLFGRSATGGAVLYTTQQPTNDFGGYVSGLLGNYAARQAEGAINLPVAQDKLSVRVAGFYSDRNGMQHNALTGARIGDLERWGIRGSAKLTLGSVTNNLVYEHFHANGQGVQAVISGLLPVNPAGGPPYFPAALLYSGNATPTATITGQCTLQAIAQFPGACPPVNPAVSGFYNGYFANPAHPSGGINGILASQQAAGPYRPFVNGRNVYHANVNTVTNQTVFAIADGLSLKNIFGYISSKTDASMDVDSTPYDIQNNLIGPLVNSRQYTDELQLSGKLLDDRLDFVIGAFYSDEKQPYFLTGQFFDLIFGGQMSIYHHILSSKTYAGYAQATYKLTDTGLSVTGGVRYTSEKAGKNIAPDDLNAGTCTTAGYDCSQHRTFQNFNYTFGLQDQVDPSLLLYATTRQAYKNGGFNGFLAPKVGPGSIGGDGFGSQRVRDVETGAKYQGRAGDLPVRLNLALYYTWIRNDQRTAYVLNPGPGTAIVNVPTGRTYGAEIDGQIQPVRWLAVGGTFNYTNAKFNNGNTIVTTVFGPVPTVYDRVPDTPRTSGSAFADVTVPLTDSINVIAHGDIYFQAKNFTGPRSYNGPGTTIPSYKLANFRLGVEDEAAGWSLTANLKNAFKKTYYTGGFALGEIYQINSLFPGERRTITVDARYKF